jgi:hypothetical protein
MLKRVLAMMTLACLVGAPAMAQEKHVTIDVLFGWSFSDGVQTDNAIVAGDGNVYNRIDPKDSFKYGIGGGALIGPNLEVGFLFGQQLSKLTLGGTTTKEVGDLTVNNYHGYLGYNFGEDTMPARLYFFGGLGATSFGTVNYTRINGAPGTTSADTQFSTTWGLGLKFFPSKSAIGARVGIQWTPTYIKSTAGGYWCDPYWGCYVGGNPHYANAWDINGGLSFHF